MTIIITPTSGLTTPLIPTHWVVISGVISRVTIVIVPWKGLVALLITKYYP